jgi:hypothetical protein
MDASYSYKSALRDTFDCFEAAGSPVIIDGWQTKPSFATYPIHGLDNIAPDGLIIPFAVRLTTVITPPKPSRRQATAILAMTPIGKNTLRIDPTDERFSAKSKDPFAVFA